MDSNSTAEAKAPVTPNKNKVTKARTTRGRAVKVPKKLAKSTGSGGDESGGDEPGIIYTAPKKAKKITATTAEESSQENETKGFDYKGSNSSDAEEGEVSEEEEDGDDMEKAEILKVVDEDLDEV